MLLSTLTDTDTTKHNIIYSIFPSRGKKKKRYNLSGKGHRFIKEVEGDRYSRAVNKKFGYQNQRKKKIPSMFW